MMLGLQKFYRNIGICVFKRNFSAPVAPFASHVSADEGKSDEIRETDERSSTNSNRAKKIEPAVNSSRAKNPIVAAAFASLLQEDSRRDASTDQAVPNKIDEQIINANTVNELLRIPGQSKLSRKQALKIVSILAEWSSIQKVKLSDFDNDTRFMQLCNVLGRTTNRNNVSKSQANQVASLHVDDLQTVLGITANDEAAKLIVGLSILQMIKVMSALAQKKKRSTPLLRSLAFNISSNTTKLNLKDCGVTVSKQTQTG